MDRISPKLPMRAERLTRGTLIRAMSPIGYYWRDAFRCAEALYSPAPDLVFTACHFDEEQHEGDYYSEFDDPILEEVRLHGSLAISLGWDQGMVSLYPHVWQMKIPELVDLRSPAVEVALRNRLSGSDFSADYQLASDPAPPPRHGGPAYQFRNSPTPTELQLQIFRAIALDDHLLLRGMSAWLKAGMLRHHRQFALEALYSMYVSLDASFSLVCRELRRRGVQNPSAIDAGRYLDEAEGREPEGAPYFGDFYNDRIQVLHPESRFGVVPYPPAMIDDLLHLNASLREVYRLLILGTILDPQNYVALDS